ncbi:hypothetical protein IMZ48_39835 [Candidatus Bathyarchaeota archaeon]|nr:hypothetical protein [Candidatus Bathyarchaeota archaeon]
MKKGRYPKVHAWRWKIVSSGYADTFRRSSTIPCALVWNLAPPLNEVSR